MRSPWHLWSGDWESESDAARRHRAEAQEQPAAAADPDQPASPLLETQRPAQPPSPTGRIKQAAPGRGLRRRPGRRATMAGVLAAVVLAALVGYLTGRGDDRRQTAGVLPALPAGPLPRHAGQSRAGAIYAVDSPAVVSIRTGGGSGTGFVIDRRGTIVTNAHVVVGAAHVLVRFGTTGRDISGAVLGSDPSSDLAVVRIDPTSEPAGVTPLGIADSRGVRVGDPVIAIGNPFGLDRTETAGIVSGLGRTIAAPNGFEIGGAIQTDAAINPGNSGGPLLDDTGRVVGVNSQIETGGVSQGNVGVGFAVPSNSIRQVIPTLERGQTISRAWLGVSTGDAPSGGATVASVIPGGPADKAGLTAGDVLTSVNGQALANSSDLAAAVAARHPGDQIHIRVTRAGQTMTIDAGLGARPAQVP